MCGRYTNRLSWREMVELYRITEGVAPRNDWQARYNIAPTQHAPVVRIHPETGGRELALFRWSLVPAWSAGPDSRFSMINARAETVREKPAYRSAFKQRRCLVPASGFYEWQTGEDGKQPYHIGLESGEPFAFAGLWEHWQPKDDREPIDSFTIIVTEANVKLQPIHDRMPVILAPEDHEAWLTGDPDTAAAMLRPFPAEAMTAYPISRRVNKPENDDPGVIEPAM